MKRVFVKLIILIVFAIFLSGCSEKSAMKSNKTIIRDLTVELKDTYKGPNIENKIQEVNSISDSYFGHDLNIIFEQSDEIVRGIVKNIEYVSFTGLPWTKADIQITESYKGILKEGDIITIFTYGGYIKLEDHIKYFDDGFRFSSIIESDIKNTVLMEKHNGKPLLKLDDDLFFPLVKNSSERPFPLGTYENLSVAGMLYIDKNGKFIQDYYDEGKKSTNVFTIDEVKSKVK